MPKILTHRSVQLAPQAFAHSNVRFRKIMFHAGGTGYTPPQLAMLYNFPKDLAGSGHAVGFVELGGGFVQGDLDTYFRSLGLQSPKVELVSVDGAQNNPSGPTSADSEVMLDLCIAIGVANGIRPVVYMAPNTEQGFVDAVERAIQDNVDAIAISWGAPEDLWSDSGRQALHNACIMATNKGITVTAAAGDNGSSDGQPGVHVDFPASSPYVLACGGTSLVASGGGLLSETVWNDGSLGGATGGGISQIFPLPPYQSPAAVPGGSFRGVPDVAADADPETGITVIVDGQIMTIGGTSAVAPFWAALVAILNQGLGKRLGLAQSAIYKLPQCFHDITSGNNGVYTARPGWDACTGLGTPDGAKLLQALGGGVAPPPAPTSPGVLTLAAALPAGTYNVVPKA